MCGQAISTRELTDAKDSRAVRRARGARYRCECPGGELAGRRGRTGTPAGGRAEDSDEDAEATALREAEEEVGLASEHVEVIGHLPEYTTITQFIVTPVVALVRPGFTLKPDPFEVDEVFEVPLAFLMNPAHHERRGLLLQGVQREFFSMPYAGRDAQGRAQTFFIWGATAAMLRNFYRFLAA